VQQHPLASPHLPWFTPSADGSWDPLFIIAAISVLAIIVLLGVLFFTLHSLPERLGHKKLQFEIVAVLGLLSLFTHMHAFWVAGLLLALVDLPDFTTPLRRMSAALEKLAGIETAEPAPAPAPDTIHATPDQLREAKEDLDEALAKGRSEARQTVQSKIGA
jgi:hypothetical protein